MAPSRFQDADFDQAQACDADDQREEQPAGIDAVRQLLDHLGELAAYARYYLSAKVDATKLQVRSAIMSAVLGLLGLVVLAATLVTATVLVLYGAALGIAALLGNRLWAGELIVGGGVLLLIGLGSYFGLSRWKKSSREAMVKKYEQRKREQRERFGHDVTERAAAESQ